MLLASLQLGPASPTIAETAARIATLVEKAGAAGAKVAALPELALTPYFAAAVHDSLDTWVSPVENTAALEKITSHAKALGIALVIPYAEQTNAGLFNSMAFVDGDGALKGKFRKMHIPGSVEPKPEAKLNILEKRYFAAGDLGFPVYDMGVAKMGGLICYDRRFPESYRSLAINGAEIIAVGYNTPVMPGTTLKVGRRASELAITAGAYYTGTTIIAAGKAGTEGGYRFIGGSFIVGPDGIIVARARTNGDEVVLGEVDLSKQATIRERWAFAVNRRPSEYVMVEPA